MVFSTFMRLYYCCQFPTAHCRPFTNAGPNPPFPKPSLQSPPRPLLTPAWRVRLLCHRRDLHRSLASVLPYHRFTAVALASR